VSLRIRFQGGPRAGEVLDFDDSVDRVRFGRDEDRCDVVFAAGDAAVGREHFALERVLGRYRIVTNGRNTLFIDGRPALDGQILGEFADLQVGDDGPRLVAEARGAESLAQTIAGGPRPVGTHTRMERMRRSLHVNRAVSLGVAGLFLLAAFWVARELFATGRRIQDVEAAVRTGDAAAERLSQVRHDELAHELVRLEEDAVRREIGFHGLAAEVEPSIYLVVSRSPGGDLQPTGTAWVVAPGVLATNAHVVEGFAGREPGAGMVLRGVGAGVADLEVESVEPHPGYAAFNTLLATYLPLLPAAGGYLKLAPACDVALLRVVPAAIEQLGPPLQMATAGDLGQLDGGAELATVGFPMEGLVGGGTDFERPQPTQQVGHLTALTDFFLGKSEAANARLIQHSMPATGGASGSPVFDRHRRVVGVHSAANFAFFQDRRIPIPAPSFAQRVDLVAELLDGRAAAAAAERTNAWEAKFHELERSGNDWLFARLLQGARNEMLARGVAPFPDPELVFETVGDLDSSGPQGGRSFALELPEDGSYVVVGVGRGANDIDLAVYLEGQIEAMDRSEDAVPLCRARGRAGQQLEFLVYPGRDAALPAHFELRVLRVAD